jgi:hypothetical protein
MAVLLLLLLHCLYQTADVLTFVLAESSAHYAIS